MGLARGGHGFRPHPSRLVRPQLDKHEGSCLATVRCSIAEPLRNDEDRVCARSLALSCSSRSGIRLRSAFTSRRASPDPSTGILQQADGIQARMPTGIH